MANSTTKDDGSVMCPKCGSAMSARGRASSGAIRWRCDNGGQYCYSTTNPGMSKIKRNGNVSNRPLRFFRPIETTGTSRFIITAAQNATPVHKDFFASLKVAAEALNAELIVIPIRYKNPTSRWPASAQGAEWWVEEVQKYLYNSRKKLNPNLVLLGDVKAQPTASSPLTGFEGLTGGESAIIGHTKVQLRVIPVPAGKLPKIMTTTGACTVPNYTDTKAGKLGEFHHTLGAAMVEVKGKTFHLRQISADSRDGSFTDLNKIFTPVGVKNAPPARGLVMGDTHVRFVCPKVVEATFGVGGIVDTLNPEYLVWHDLLDGYSANPHHLGNPFVAAAKLQSGFNNVKKEVEDTIEFLDKYTGERKSIVVASNHDNFLSRWVMREDWKRDPENAKFYLETALEMFSSTKMGETGTQFDDPFKHWVDMWSNNPRVRCLGGDESFALAGIECGMHGHRGPNGAQGSVKNLSRLGTKVVSGHGHAPAIEEGHFRTGTSTRLRAEYTEGPSSWLNTHCIIYASGKRSLITIIDGQWKI